MALKWLVVSVALLTGLVLVGSAGAQQAAVKSAPAPVAAPPVGVPVASDYVIGAEDLLQVSIWKNEAMSRTLPVRPDGKISLPLLHDIQAAGLTPLQLRDKIAAALGEFMPNPEVSVTVMEVKSYRVSVLGEVQKPGVLQLTGDLTLLQAISLMGGVLPEADGEKGFLLRRDRKIPIDFDRLAQRGDLSQNPKLEAGDSVVVPLADSVYVSGEVKKPGAVKFAGDLTLLKALTQAGGLTPLAAGSRVDIIRGDPEKKSRIRVDVDRIMRSPDGNQDVRLRPNDIITVPQRRF